MQGGSHGQDHYLIEAKASMNDQSIHGTLEEEIPRLANYVALCRSIVRVGRVTGLLIGTVIEEVDLYKCYVYEIN